MISRVVTAITCQYSSHSPGTEIFKIHNTLQDINSVEQCDFGIQQYDEGKTEIV